METKIAIVGGGISGLAAAMTLERSGYSAHIYDKKQQTGGRVATDFKNGLPLDHGFQVLLDAYPAVDEFLDMAALDLCRFRPGAKIRFDGKESLVGDASRDQSFLWGTITSSVGSLSDKWKMFSLSRKLKNKSLKDIFSAESMTTQAYLRKEGFSDKIIDRFFRPFYGGIFLEDKLETSSRMFEFVFKMFAQGNACIPKNGISEIPKQMTAALEKSTFYPERGVTKIQGNKLQLDDDTEEEYSHIIIATTAHNLLDNLPLSITDWQGCHNLYFKTENPGMGKPLIGLSADDGCCINNYHFLQDLFTDSPVLSVTILDDIANTREEIIDKAKADIDTYLDIRAGDCVGYYQIKNALPVIPDLQYAMEPTETQLTDHIFLAGDHLSNASLNAAMLNGKAAAQSVVDKIENRVVVG